MLLLTSFGKDWGRGCMRPRRATRPATLTEHCTRYVHETKTACSRCLNTCYKKNNSIKPNYNKKTCQKVVYVPSWYTYKYRTNKSSNKTDRYLSFIFSWKSSSQGMDWGLRKLWKANNFLNLIQIQNIYIYSELNYYNFY